MDKTVLEFAKCVLKQTLLTSEVRNLLIKMKIKGLYTAFFLSLLFVGALITVKSTIAYSEPETITVPEDYPTIQEAVVAAEEGDTVFVKAGTYYEDFVSVDKSVSLLGDNQQSSVYFLSSVGFVVTADGVNIKGLTIANNEANQGHAIDISNSSDCVVENNLIENNEVGISVYGSSSGNTISGNVLENNERSIELIDSWGNTISGNNISGALVSGISLDLSLDNVVSANWIADLENEMGALMLWKSSNNLVSRNVIFGGNLMLMIDCSSNVFSENFIVDSEAGVVVGVSSNNRFFNNYFINVTEAVVDNELENGQASVNFWDNGYPLGGNYWSDYVGTDFDGDGIGDTTYVLYENNQDNYPLIDYPPITTDSNEPTGSSSANSSLPTEVVIGVVAVVVILLSAVVVMKLKKR